MADGLSGELPGFLCLAAPPSQRWEMREDYVSGFCLYLRSLHCSKYCSTMQERQAGSGNRVKRTKFFISH